MLRTELGDCPSATHFPLPTLSCRELHEYPWVAHTYYTLRVPIMYPPYPLFHIHLYTYET